MSTTTEQQKALTSKLQEVLRKPDTIIFIGAGVSRWSGLPSWYGLIEELAVFVEQQGLPANLVRRELQNNDLLQAASYGVDLLTKQLFAEFIRKACRVDTARPQAIHQKIVNLGANSYITTNYDTLLEDSLRTWKPDRLFRTVTNSHITETADIAQATATNYIFKPHGDVWDVDSVILTREQYRVLRGEKARILETFKILLVSRPVVFIGFGLKDLDFTYIKDTLANIYSGGARDHYAIMADVSEQERAYWRKNYGIHLISYETPNGQGRDHSALLGLLDELIIPLAPTNTQDIQNNQDAPMSAEAILALTRYAARVSRLDPPRNAEELPLQVSIDHQTTWRRPLSRTGMHFSHAPVHEFLANHPQNAILLGAPGAGKTYALQQHCAKTAQKLQDICLNDPDKLVETTIPIYIDLKIYDGNLWRMAQNALPPNLSLTILCATGKVQFIIDAVNEAPKEYFEQGQFEADLAEFLKKSKTASILFSSRTSDGLTKLKLPTFRLEEIAPDFIEQYVELRQEQLTGSYRREVLSLLQKPLFFALYRDRKITLGQELHPKNVYQSFFDTLSAELTDKLGFPISLAELLEGLAYSAVDEGEEAVLLTEASRHIKNLLRATHQPVDAATSIINWLVAKNVFIPMAGVRITFYHQTLTEYLAAQALAKRYRAASDTLERCLRNTRWDQALFLTLGFLSQEETQQFIESVTSADLLLAIRAAKYAEWYREEVVTQLLNNVLKRPTLDFNEMLSLAHSLQDLPVSQRHESVLKQILDRGNAIGGAAAALLAKNPTDKIKSLLIEKLLSSIDDYNFCTSLGQALKPLLSQEDAIGIARRLGGVGLDLDPSGISRAVAKILSGQPASTIAQAFMPWQEKSALEQDTFKDWLQDDKGSDESFRLILDVLRQGMPRAVVPLYFRLNFDRITSERCKDALDAKVIECTITAATSPNDGRWAIDALKHICELRPDLAFLVKAQAAQTHGATQVALYHATISSAPDAFWSALKAFPTEVKNLRGEIPGAGLLQAIDPSVWAGHELLLLGLLRLRRAEIAINLLEDLHSQTRIQSDALRPLEWWLDWMNEKPSNEQQWQQHWWLRERFSAFLVHSTSEDIHTELVSIFNTKNCPYRSFLENHVLFRLPDLTTDHLSEDANNFLLSTLSRPINNSIHGPLLGSIATEHFVRDKLLPLLSSTEPRLKKNVCLVLKAAGKRHRRRYITEEDIVDNVAKKP